MRLLLLFLGSIALVAAQFQQGGYPQGGGFRGGADQRIPQPNPNLNYGSSNSYTEYEENLVRYGELAGDQLITDDARQNGYQIALPLMFPYYGGRYNYTMISSNGYIGFAYFSDTRDTPQVGMDVDWPRVADPAVIAPYLCRQRLSGGRGADAGIFYRVEMRRNTAQSSQGMYDNSGARPRCLGKKDYVRCDEQSDQFLDAMQKALQQGVAGASTFRAEAAVVVTWKNMRPNIGDEQGLATYQLVWLTDAQGLLSYTMINYNRLGYDAADFNEGARTGKCQAVFNGGNHTGTVQVDLSEQTKMKPSSLASRSAIPHVARGRYVHRVDDVVRPAGCSNKTGGTFPLLVYPNIVTMLGQTKVDVNGLCLNPAVTYVLMIEQRQSAPCEILNPSIARCALPKVLDWGTKTVFFQPQSGLSNDEKAYVGFIYFVPPTIDPMRLDIGDIHSWFLNPPLSNTMSIKWYPRNFTQPLAGNADFRSYFDDSVYSVTLGLYAVGYKEAQDKKLKKFVPKHRVLARLATFQNRVDDYYRWNPIIEKYNIDRLEQWYLDKDELRDELFTYRFGYLKLAPIPHTDTVITDGKATLIELDEGLVSSPISLHWMWTLPPDGEYHGSATDPVQKREFVKDKSKDMCAEWYEEDGALDNFIRETETNSSCPCKEEQAKMDLGRYMPHPRCSTLFRDVSCTETLGSANCYMSAQNVHGSTYKHTARGDEQSSYNTHYGQTCCYDNHGYLMQSTYQPIVKIDDSTPYSPGYPTRAYEMGSEPFQGMFEVPGLSTFHHDIMPYYLCCKYADFRCQMFYWRRPSSACQAYEPPVTGSILGAGVISTLNNRNLIFNEPGIFTLLHSYQTLTTPEVQIQVRMERFPDRSVDFGKHDMSQKDLVQPSNVTVITGVVLQGQGAERVHIVLRKDTRRGRYKTSVIVGNVIRYFDNMHIQRFRGVTIYTNNVEKGQAEIYVVLDDAQIGMRIRETYAIDIDRKFQYMESLGLLDLQISVPPKYKIHHDYGQVRTLDTPRVEGLINPFPDEPFREDYTTLGWSNVNEPGTRQQLMKYKVKGESDTQNVNLNNEHGDVQDLFSSRSDNEKLFQAYADHYLKGPVYKASSDHLADPFVPQTEMDFREFMAFCKNTRDLYRLNSYEQARYKRCPIDMGALESDCGNDVTCLFDAVMLQARLLGDEARESFNYYLIHRMEGVARYNSCGAVNVEYPEYLLKGPSSGEPAYLEGNKLSFSCYQTHIIKGDAEFTCARELNEHDNTWKMQWTQGEQPWCRHRVAHNALTWIFWVAIAVVCIAIPICIFAVFWTFKQRHRQEQDRRRNDPNAGAEMVPLNKPKPDIAQIETLEKSPLSKPSPASSFAKGPGSERGSDISRLDRPPARTGSQSNLVNPQPSSSFTPNSQRRQPPPIYSQPQRPTQLQGRTGAGSNRPGEVSV